MLNTAIALVGYTVNETLHQTANTSVYRGYRENDHKPVVIKLLQAEYPTLEEINRFRHEYEIAHDLNLAGVVKPYDLINYNNGLALILEDFGGQSLKNVIDFGNLEIIDFIFIAIRIADILGELHTHNILHKDIKPQNIIYNAKTLQVKLTDFSIASLISRESPTLAGGRLEQGNPNSLEGTLAYISPEQTGRMNRAIDYRADLYSLGITFYEMLTGQLPFTANDPLELIHCHIAKNPTPPDELNQNIPPVVSSLVMKLLAKTADDRYQSAFGLKADLEECLMQLHATGKIATFGLGRQDKSGQFKIPEKLYGRETDIGNLLEAFERVSLGATEIVLVTGYSGIGKTSLVNEVHPQMVSQGGYFSSGKCDQFKQTVAYSALTQAFSGLIRQLLTESQSRVEVLQEKLLTIFGGNGQLIIDLIPEVELIVGKCPVEYLELTESQNRLNLLFKQFIQVFSEAEHPLVLFLDDLQWVDAASLQVIQMLLADADSKYILIIGAYRDREVSTNQALVAMLDKWRLNEHQVQTITLDNLSYEDVKELIVETLHEPVKKIKPIAELVLEKTEGNPFFVTQLLKSLYQEHLLTFNFRSGRWQWDIGELQSAAIADNVVELMVNKIQKFPSSTQQLLQIAAGFGNEFNLNNIAVLSDRSIEYTAKELLPALQSGLILPVSDEYTSTETLEWFDELLVDYRFLHEPLQQAAYALISEDQKKALHLKIGQLLFNNNQIDQLEKNIFEIVKHLNIGAELIKEQSEKYQLAGLNFIAANKAKSSNNYDTALHYLKLAIEILAEDSWVRDYKLTFDLYLQRIECEYLAGNFDAAEAFVEIALDRTATKLDKCKINNIRLIHYQNTGRYENAVKVGLASLKIFDLELPDVADEATLNAAIEEVKQNLNNRAIADLCHAPEMSDAEQKMLLYILMNLVMPSYLLDRALLVLDVLKMLNTSLKYGNTNLSAFIYVWYGAILCSNFNQYELGYEWGNSGLRLNETFNDPSLNGKVYMSFGNFINHWRNHVSKNISIQAIAYQAAKESGHFSWCHHSALFSFWQRFVISQDLNSIPTQYEKYISFAKETDQTAALALTLQQRIFLNLKGLTTNKYSLSDESFSESSALERFQAHNYEYGMNTYHFAKLFIFFIYEHYTDAYKMALEVEQTITAIAGQFQVALHYFYKSLTLLALYPKANDLEKQEYWETLQNHREKLKIWSDNAPENFAANYFLVEAEIARILGEKAEASDLYDRAIALAKENQFIYTEALANELAAKFYLLRGKEKIAKIYIRDAHYILLKWGAIAKVKDIEAKYPHLLDWGLDPQTKISKSLTTTTTTTSSTSNSSALDWRTVVKASLAISGEIVLENLLKKLMKIALENAGAKNGCFITKKENQWFIEAEGTIDREEVTALESIPIDANILPISIINYVERTKENLVIDDALRVETFATDPYIVEKKPKSILCFPIIHQAKFMGILYLENNLTTAAFTSDRLEVLKVLTSQVSISIENAILYKNLQSYSQAVELKNQELQQSETREREKAQALAEALHKQQQTQSQLIQTEKISSLGQLVAGVAHEVNNPIGFIAGNLEHAKGYIKDLMDILSLYQEHYPSPASDIQDFAEEIDLEYLLEDLPKMINSMKMGTDRIREIMSSLRTFSRVDTNQKQLADLHQGLDSTLLILQHRLKANSERPTIQVVKKYGNIPSIECYAGQLNQVFMNLIANAIDVFDEYNVGRSYAEIERNPNAIVIRTEFIDNIPVPHILIGIKDNGSGMTEEVRNRLFSAFFTTKPSGKGTGLGLSISYQIVTEKHGGKLSCISSPGEGAEFVIEIPALPLDV